jgi:UDP-N-acetylglucosamine 4-epimerase
MKVLVTGGAGFIGSNIVDKLITMENITTVRVLDNLSTGYMKNISAHENNAKFEFIKGDIAELDDCMKACEGINAIINMAALGSVPRSIDDPIASTRTNVLGNVTIMHAAVQQGVKRFVYASSSSTYGDNPNEQMVEGERGNLLSPYAVTKRSGELFGNIFYKTYGLETIGLIFFNVFGPKQNKQGAYAAVIPIFITNGLEGKQSTIYGNGSNARDFTFIENVVQANLAAITTTNKACFGNAYNIALGNSTSVLELHDKIKALIGHNLEPLFAEPRKGDIPFSLANVNKTTKELGFTGKVTIDEGLKQTVQWYKDHQ